MKKSLSAIFYSLLLIFSVTSRAEFPSQPLANLGNLAALLANPGKSYVEEELYDPNGRIFSNLPVQDSARGETADQLARLLSGGSEPLRQRLVVNFLKNRDRFMQNLSSNNYVANDMGVAYAVSFVLFWELASNGELTQSASDKAAKFLVHRFRSTNKEYANITLEDKAKAYDWLITAPVAIATLIMAYEKAGRGQEVKMLRDASASMFVNAFKIPHDMLEISESGELHLDSEKVLAYQKRHALDR
ncbi:MAG: hypothetical protein ABW092_06140 [Candidatus Thiodiazotropha sp.]